MTLERITEITPSYDKRHQDPSKNYGYGSCDLRMVVKGPLGAIQFVMATGWLLPGLPKDPEFYPFGSDVGYHSPKPTYEGQEPMQDDCHYIGGTCYYDGSSLAAEKMTEILISEGSEKVWELLEQRYKQEFDA